MKPERQRRTGALEPWPDEAERNFWQHLKKKADREGLWFSLMMRNGIVKYLKMSGHLMPGMNVLDYGCGPGNLIEVLLNEGTLCFGIEKSAETVEEVNRRFESSRNWQRAVVHENSAQELPTGEMDLITCIETLEHLSDSLLSDVMAEILRLLRPGGVALFTVPNDERLESNFVMCPFCSTEFHPVQHVRSFTVCSLSRCLSDQGFEVAACVPTDLARFQQSPVFNPFDLSIRNLAQKTRLHAFRGLDRQFPRPFPEGREFRLLTGQGPHLTALAQRPQGLKKP